MFTFYVFIEATYFMIIIILLGHWNLWDGPLIRKFKLCLEHLLIVSFLLNSVFQNPELKSKMEVQTFTDEIDCGSFFDHIDDLIDFPPVTDTSLDAVDCNEFTDIWNTNSDELQVSDPIFSESNCAATLSEELAVPVSNH